MGAEGLPGALVEGLLANTLFALLVAVGAIAISNLLRRRRVHRFFGVLPTRGAIRVVLPGIEVLKRSTLGTGPIVDGFFGVAINDVEYRAALDLASAIESRPLARALHTLAQQRITIRPVICNIELGPSCRAFRDEVQAGREDEARRRIGEAISGCTVLVGGPVYNVMAYVATTHPESRVAFTRTEIRGEPTRGIQVRAPDGAIYDFTRSTPDDRSKAGQKGAYVEYFLVERRALDDSSWLFLCAGTGIAGTAAAVRVLASWRELAKRFGEEPFLLVYRLSLDNLSDRETDPDLDRIQQCYVFPPRS